MKTVHYLMIFSLTQTTDIFYQKAAETQVPLQVDYVLISLSFALSFIRSPVLFIFECYLSSLLL